MQYVLAMHNSKTNCNGILEAMAEAISDSALQALFVSTQQINLRLCTKFAIEEYVSSTITQRTSLTSRTDSQDS